MGHQNHRRLRRRRLQLFRMRSMPTSPSKPNHRPKEKLLTYTPLNYSEKEITFPHHLLFNAVSCISKKRQSIDGLLCRQKTANRRYSSDKREFWARAKKRVLLVFVAGYVVSVSHVNQLWFLCAAYFPDLDWASCVESASRRRINWARNLPWDDRFAPL